MEKNIEKITYTTEKKVSVNILQEESKKA